MRNCVNIKNMIFKRLIPDLILGSISCVLFGCVGPISPFGGLEFWSGDGENFSASSTDSSSSEFSLHPKRQVLHKPSDFKIAFNLNHQEKTSTIIPQIKVVYNNKEVTHTFLKSALRQDRSEKHFQYVFNNLNLKPDRRHQIDVYWRMDKEARFSHLAYLPPHCSMNISRRIASTEPFNPKKEYIGTINSIAQAQQLNPALLAGLIAQESGFNPSLVSRAKAVGLTQVTSIADDELKKIRPEWQRDPRIDQLSVMEVERLIRMQEISRRQDWRLDPEQAIEGGALYMNYLIDYWNLTENKNILMENAKADRTEVILASYNSGAARVKNKMKADGEYWLDNDELKEAFKYVNSVMSYCYHFSEEE